MKILSPSLIIIVILGYFSLLFVVSQITSKGASNRTFFNANKQSPWLLVAIGMIGATLSGATFISIPGVVGKGGLNMNLSYMQVVLGYLLGYFVIAVVLMPLYYRLQLTTIYGYLYKRFGIVSYKTGAGYFLLSRVVGASLRLFLMAIILQTFVMDAFNISFGVTVAITIIFIWIYTFRGGIKTIVWTDTIQTVCMLTALVVTIISISQSMDSNISELWNDFKVAGYSKMFYFKGGWEDPNNFYKQFLSGALIAIVMTGLDQDMMQKNLTCRSLKDAQKNIFTFSVILVFTKILFLVLGGLLYIYATKKGLEIPANSDLLFPEIVFNHLNSGVGLVFILGLVAAAYSSADSALTSLTTTFCVDFLELESKKLNESKKIHTRLVVHICFSLILFVVTMIFNATNNDSIINSLFIFSGYTYGPILGLFTFGIISNRKIRDKWSLLVCILAPIITFILDNNSEAWFDGFKFGFLIIAINGLLTFLGLFFISHKQNSLRDNVILEV